MGVKGKKEKNCVIAVKMMTSFSGTAVRPVCHPVSGTHKRHLDSLLCLKFGKERDLLAMYLLVPSAYK